MERRLYRSEQDKMIAGVCGGLGAYFGIDPTLVRVLFIVVAFAGGAGVPIYLALWLIVPRESRVGSPGTDVARDAAEEVRDTVQRGADQAKGAYERWRADRGASSGAAGGAGDVPPPPADPGMTDPGATAPPPPPPADPGTTAPTAPPEPPADEAR